MMKRSRSISVVGIAVLLAAAMVWSIGFRQRPQHPDVSSGQNSHNAAAMHSASVTRCALDEVVSNILAQPVGSHTVAVYDLPEAFLRRAADRVIRAAFEEQFRIVIGSDQQPRPVFTPSSPASVSVIPTTIRIVEQSTPTHRDDVASLPGEGFPPLHGYRANILNEGKPPWPYSQPDEATSPSMRAAAKIVAERLPRDGLLETTANVIMTLGPKAILESPPHAAILEPLREVGLPTDLLECYANPEGGSAEGVVRWMASIVVMPGGMDEIRRQFQQAPFRWRPSHPGFRVATESGEHTITGIRAQFTRGGYWDGVGDGGNLDLMRSVIEAIPNISVCAAIRSTDLREFTATSQSWPLNEQQPLTLISVDHTVSQWAQDNGKSGHIDAGEVTLVPRYASRNEVGSQYIFGESLVMNGLSAAGWRIIQSPLLFQGGNLLAVQHPSSGERILLIGEAEVHRNRVLGLSEAEILAAFKSEFGVDRCEVLPAVSFHIDYDLTVRAHDGRLIAFVNDSTSACVLILTAAVDALRSHQLMDPVTASNAAQAIAEGEWRDVVTDFGSFIHGKSDGHGRFPLEFAKVFSRGPADSGVGNLHRILHALDTLASLTLSTDELGEDEPLREYMRSLARRESEHAALHHRLREVGFDVVLIPGLSNGSRGISALNGIHAEGIYLMPAYGGLFEDFDELAQSAIDDTLGGSVRIIPVPSGESQRRSGAVHCSLGAMYQPSASP